MARIMQNAINMKTDNELIAEFMGLCKVEENYSKLPCYYYPCLGGHMQITD